MSKENKKLHNIKFQIRTGQDIIFNKQKLRIMEECNGEGQAKKSARKVADGFSMFLQGKWIVAKTIK